ncbi:hypothetical protein GINT2_002289 [Glugoides intestinalis]
MNIEIENDKPFKLNSSRVPFRIGASSSYRTEFFGNILITFSYNVGKENESSTVMSIEHSRSHTSFQFVEDKRDKIVMSEEIALLGDSSGFKEFSFPSMINRVFLMASENPLPKGNVLEGMYASGLVESNEEKIEMMKIVHENMPKDRNEAGTGIFNSETPEGTNEWDDFIRIIDSILENVPLEDPEVFDKFAPFLLHSEKYKNKLKGVDLKLIFNLNNENVSEHWIKYAGKKGINLRCSFNIEKRKDAEFTDLIAFCKKFSNLTYVKLFFIYFNNFDKKAIWNTSEKILSEIPTCTELELFLIPCILKHFITEASLSNSKVLSSLVKLKINFNIGIGIIFINKEIANLSEITIQNLSGYTKLESFKADKLVNLIKKLPVDRSMTINLIGRNIKFSNGTKRKTKVEYR